MATSRTQEPAWLLHSTPYRETSLIVDLFTREHGRIAAVAKGAKRPRSALRAVLLQFQPLLVAYAGQRELRTLTGVEWTGGLAAPQGDALLCAFYLNELLMRL
ncbi:MAG: DNA repair protein RecO, partial [Burkholderiales bacterium]